MLEWAKRKIGEDNQRLYEWSRINGLDESKPAEYRSRWAGIFTRVTNKNRPRLISNESKRPIPMTRTERGRSKAGASYGKITQSQKVGGEVIDEISFEVHGKASPSGSKKAFIHNRTGKVIVMDTAKNKDLWQNIVSMVARKAVSDQHWLQTCDAVNLCVTFLFKRPKSHFGSGKSAMILKNTAPIWHTQKPDLTKLVRCLEDALTGVIWNDDCQVVETSVRKRWAERDSVQVLVRAQS